MRNKSICLPFSGECNLNTMEIAYQTILICSRCGCIMDFSGVLGANKATILQKLFSMHESRTWAKKTSLGNYTQLLGGGKSAMKIWFEMTFRQWFTQHALEEGDCWYQLAEVSRCNTGYATSRCVLHQSGSSSRAGQAGSGSWGKNSSLSLCTYLFKGTWKWSWQKWTWDSLK